MPMRMALRLLSPKVRFGAKPDAQIGANRRDFKVEDRDGFAEAREGVGGSMCIAVAFSAHARRPEMVGDNRRIL
jgi:hypothetical protein